jgi:hypothetical protein
MFRVSCKRQIIFEVLKKPIVNHDNGSEPLNEEELPLSTCVFLGDFKPQRLVIPVDVIVHVVGVFQLWFGPQFTGYALIQ